MNKHTEDILEFNKILELLKEKCATELGREKIEEIKPVYNLDLVRISLNEVEEVRNILDREGALPFGQIFDIRKDLSQASIGQVLNEIELVKVAVTLKSLSSLFSFILSQKSEKPLLIAKEIGSVPDFGKVVESINKCIDFDGTVLDSASDNLRSIRNDIKITERRIREKINQIATSEKYKSYLSDQLVTERNGRFCVPVKAEFKSQVPGIVHDSSGSGQTLFVEPGIIVDMGNKLKDLHGKERDEIYKILSMLSGFVGEYSESGIFALDVAGNIDVIYAKACLSYDMKGNKPKINEKGKINLIDAFHPLLMLKNPSCVPISLQLGDKFHCLLITGPNTGGKTVTLKTVGLITLMVMCGMFPPCASESEVSLFREIWTDIGDEQSIEQSLSTFSAHIKNIVSILEASGKTSLVLLDELGAGTDPQEGSALARAILEELMAKDCKTIATTHYGELKNFAFVTDGIENASVEFDINTLSPTYRLLIGIPGSSNAFHIAKRIGMPSSVIERAEAAQNKEKDQGSEILSKIEEIHKEAGLDRIEAAKRLKEIEEIKASYADKLSKLEHREATIEDKIKKRANKVIRQYTEKINETLEALKNTQEEDATRQGLRKELTGLVENFEFDIKKPMKAPEQIEEKPPLETVKVGDEVWVKSLNMTGYVEEYKNDNNITVMVGSIKMTMTKDNLAEAPKEKKPKQKPSNHNLTTEKLKNFKPELKLLGMRAEDAILELDKFMDNAVVSGAEAFRVVHGKGTGALRSAVHLYLKENPHVKSFEICGPEEGGDGATKVYL